jgi:hypothetical protein
MIVYSDAAVPPPEFCTPSPNWSAESGNAHKVMHQISVAGRLLATDARAGSVNQRNECMSREAGRSLGAIGTATALDGVHLGDRGSGRFEGPRTRSRRPAARSRPSSPADAVSQKRAGKVCPTI